jgi:hypothetical protein
MSTETRWGSGVNAEAIQAWDGPLFDRFVRFRHLLTTGLGVHGEAALALHPPPRGGRVIDIGCGFVGRDVEEAIDLVMSLGPAGEILRLAGDRAAHLHDAVHDALKDGLSELATGDGLHARASTWIVNATA